MLIYSRRFQFATVIMLAVAAVFVFSGNVSAHEGHEHAEAPTAFVYTARKNDSLTKVVRRSLLIYSQIKKVPVSEAAVVFSETKAVQQLGSRRLEIGETVMVPFATLEATINESKGLTPAQTQAWQRYASRANFKLTGLEPINRTEAETAIVTPQTEQEPAPAPQAQTPVTDSEPDESFQWYYAVLGIVAIAIVYYLLGGRYRPPQPKPTPKKAARK